MSRFRSRLSQRLGGSRGFSIVEILIVVAIIGLLASIMVPHLVDAMHKAKQRRTMVDLRNVGMAWLSWLTDQVGAASAGQGKFYDRGAFITVNYTDVAIALRPSDTFFYMEEIPQKDGWFNDIWYQRDANIGASSAIMVCSSGRDQSFGACGDNLIPVAPYLSTNYDKDIIWADGFFVRWPEGIPNQ